jgi:hypothetical protein
MNNEMLKELNDFIGTDTLVSIYSDTEDPDSFTLGYILQADKDYVLINMIDSLGEENGLCIININDIFVFVNDKMYSEKIEKLFKLKKQVRRDIGKTDIDSVTSFLKYAANNNMLIIVNDDDNFMGFVAQFSKETLVLKLVDNYGSDVGTATINMNNVNTLDCQTKHLKTLELLTSH